MSTFGQRPSRHPHTSDSSLQPPPVIPTEQSWPSKATRYRTFRPDDWQHVETRHLWRLLSRASRDSDRDLHSDPSGAVTQLVECQLCKLEVGSSSLLRSTQRTPSADTSPRDLTRWQPEPATCGSAYTPEHAPANEFPTGITDHCAVVCNRTWSRLLAKHGQSSTLLSRL